MSRKGKSLTPEQRSRFRERVARQCDMIGRLMKADAAGSRVPDFIVARAIVVLFRVK